MHDENNCLDKSGKRVVAKNTITVIINIEAKLGGQVDQELLAFTVVMYMPCKVSRNKPAMQAAEEEEVPLAELCLGCQFSAKRASAAALFTC